MKLPSLIAVMLLALTTPDASIARPHRATSYVSAVTCGIDQYRNVSGNCVHRPMRSNTVPQGATAQCRDGTYSFSQHHRGTCSYHGGVAQWL